MFQRQAATPSGDDERVIPSGSTPWASTGPALATPMRRLVGFLIDQGIFVVIFVIILRRSGLDGRADFINPTYERDALILVAMELIYPTVLIALLGQTVGCLVAKVRIVRQEDAGVPGWSRAVRRVGVGSLPSLVVPFAGLLFSIACYAWIFRDPRRQGLHDKAAGTLVIDARPG
jgi:uncharacterized RDD family membrane protein YckC